MEIIMNNAKDLEQKITAIEKELQEIQDNCVHEEYVKQQADGRPIKACKVCNKELGMLSSQELDEWMT